MRLTVLSLSEGQRNCQAPPGFGDRSSTTNPRPGASPRFLRWYAEDSPAWPAPMTTMSLLSATRGVGGRVDEGWGGLEVLVSPEELFVLIAVRILQRKGGTAGPLLLDLMRRALGRSRFPIGYLVPMPVPATHWVLYARIFLQIPHVASQDDIPREEVAYQEHCSRSQCELG
jgi:hypothetical protein